MKLKKVVYLNNKKNTDKENLDCFASKASNEIMLDRISNGKDLEFPFGSSITIK